MHDFIVGGVKLLFRGIVEPTKDVKQEENMTEEIQDVEAEASAQVVEEQQQTGENTQAAAEESVSDQDRNWSQARDTMKSQSDELRMLRSEMENLRGANQAASQEKQKKYFTDRDSDDIPTIAEVENALMRKEQEIDAKLAMFETKSRYPDIDSVIEQYGKTLPQSVKEAIIRAPNPHAAAYDACVNSASYFKDKMANSQSEKAKRVENNLKKPGSASSSGGTGALGKASVYENMSDADILNMSHKIQTGRY